MSINQNDLLSEFNENIKFDYNLKKRNWFNIGGNAKIFYKAENLKELIKFLKLIENKEKIFVLGGGSNTLITDKTYDGVVIKLSNNFNNISLLSEDIIIAGSAVSDKSLSEFAMDNSLGGFEFLSCIPGTVGGGIKMNAGCFGREFKDILISVQAINKSRQVVTIPSKEITSFVFSSRRATSTDPFPRSLGPIANRIGTPLASYSANFQPGFLVSSSSNLTAPRVVSHRKLSSFRVLKVSPKYAENPGISRHSLMDSPKSSSRGMFRISNTICSRCSGESTFLPWSLANASAPARRFASRLAL